MQSDFSDSAQVAISGRAVVARLDSPRCLLGPVTR